MLGGFPVAQGMSNCVMYLFMSAFHVLRHCATSIQCVPATASSVRSTSPSGLNLLACVTRCRCGLFCSPLQKAMFFQATIALTSGPPLAMCPHSCHILLSTYEDHLCSPIL